METVDSIHAYYNINSAAYGIPAVLAVRCESMQALKCLYTAFQDKPRYTVKLSGIGAQSAEYALNDVREVAAGTNLDQCLVAILLALQSEDSVNFKPCAELLCCTPSGMP